MPCSDDDRDVLARIEYDLARTDPAFIRRANALHDRLADQAPSWRALGASIALLMANMLLFAVGMHNNPLLVIGGLALFPLVLLPIKRSSERHRRSCED